MVSKELIDIFYALEDSFIGEYVRSSIWLFPVIESFHLIGLGILGGSVVLMDFKLMKLIFRGTDKIYVLEQTKNFFIFMNCFGTPCISNTFDHSLKLFLPLKLLAQMSKIRKSAFIKPVGLIITSLIFCLPK